MDWFASIEQSSDACAVHSVAACTKASVIDHVLIYGGAKYQETGRGFVIERATLKDIWMFFYFTHFSIGLEMFILLVIYAMVSQPPCTPGSRTSKILLWLETLSNEIDLTK